MASRRGAPTTVTSAAPATTHCSYSTSSAIWSGARCGQATCTRPTAGARYWNQSCRATGARRRGYIFEATRPSPTRGYTNSSKLKASATRSGFQPTGSCRKRLDTCSSARSVDRRMRCAATMPASAPGAELEEAPPGGGENRVASGRALSAGRLHRHQPGTPGRARCRLLQSARHRGAMDHRRQGRNQVDPAVMPHLRRQRRPSSAPRPSPTTSATS